jgi:hypothetical protein
MSYFSNKSILEKLKTIDGSGSGLDADKLDGLESIQFARKDIDETFSGNVTISGDLIVNGSTSTINSTDLAIEDNEIILNKGETGSGVSKGEAGIEIDRGTSDNAKFIWDESDDSWKFEVGSVSNYVVKSSISSVKVEDSDKLDGNDSGYYLDWNNTTNKPTTISGYGITDAYTKTEVDNKLNGKANANLDNVSDNTILDKLKNVDGSGSGLDSDTLDGYNIGYMPILNISSSSSTTSIELNDAHYTVIVDATNGNFTVKMPSSPNTGKVYNIKRIDASANSLTIDGNSKNIDGDASITLNNQYDCVSLQYDGTLWCII